MIELQEIEGKDWNIYTTVVHCHGDKTGCGHHILNELIKGEQMLVCPYRRKNSDHVYILGSAEDVLNICLKGFEKKRREYNSLQISMMNRTKRSEIKKSMESLKELIRFCDGVLERSKREAKRSKNKLEDGND